VPPFRRPKPCLRGSTLLNPANYVATPLCCCRLAVADAVVAQALDLSAMGFCIASTTHPRGASREDAHSGRANTADKLRSGARVRPGRRGHEAAPPHWPRCRRKLRLLHPLLGGPTLFSSCHAGPTAGRPNAATLRPAHARTGLAPATMPRTLGARSASCPPQPASFTGATERRQPALCMDPHPSIQPDWPPPAFPSVCPLTAMSAQHRG